MVEVVAAKERFFPALTGIRFFAATAVLVFHFGASAVDRSHPPAFLSRLLHNGYLGVSLFFVLSGYILTHTYYQRLNRPSALARYIYARWTRLYPTYILALCLGLFAIKAPLSYLSATGVLLMVQSWGSPQSAHGYDWIMQAWTISIEFFFYLTFPIILLAVRRSALWIIVALTGGLCVLIVTHGLSSVTPDTRDFRPFTLSPLWPLPILRLPEFALGVLAYLLQDRFKSIAESVSTQIFTVLNIILIVTICAAGTSAVEKSVTAILFAALCVQLGLGCNSVTRILASPPLVLLGGASYAIYLLQGPVHGILVRALPLAQAQLISPVMTVGLAIVVHRMIEEPARRSLVGLLPAQRNRLRSVRPLRSA